MTKAKKHPLDGYDFRAVVPRGTPLLVVDEQGAVWRLTRKGVRYHHDVRSLLHGARRAKAPPPWAASLRLRALIERVLREGDHEPGSRGGSGEGTACPAGPRTRWTDQQPGSYGSRPWLEVGDDGVVRAVRPVYDDSPVVAWMRLSAAELRRVRKDLALAPVGVHLPVVHITERTVQVDGSHPLAAQMATIPGARPLDVDYIRPSLPGGPGWREAITARAAALGGRVVGASIAVPRQGTGWEVPITAWRRLTAD